MDQISLTRIKKLHPLLRDDAVAIMCECDAALSGRAKVRIVSTLRTFKEQELLYAQGRTTKGQKVTNAKAGQSIHNYGLALDIALVIDGKTASWDTVKDWDGDRQSDWMEIVTVFKRHGWSWGGDWRSFKDMPHFEKTFGHTWRTLKPLYDSGHVDKEGYVIVPTVK